MPYYAPEELVYAAGMVPFGMWGSNRKTISQAKEYCATFYCTIAQLDLEMLLDGTMDLLDGIITPAICDTLRPMTQNIRVAMERRRCPPSSWLIRSTAARVRPGVHRATSTPNVKNELEKIRGQDDHG